MARLRSEWCEQPEAVVVLKSSNGNTGQGCELAHPVSHDHLLLRPSASHLTLRQGQGRITRTPQGGSRHSRLRY